MLLVLDNCEHVIEAAAALAVDTLRGAPGVRVLATNREPLRTEGEHVHRLSPCESPRTARQLSAAEAFNFPADCSWNARRRQ
jgi:predicted ATPase